MNNVTEVVIQFAGWSWFRFFHFPSEGVEGRGVGTDRLVIQLLKQPANSH